MARKDPIKKQNWKAKIDQWLSGGLNLKTAVEMEKEAQSNHLQRLMQNGTSPVGCRVPF